MTTRSTRARCAACTHTQALIDKLAGTPGQPMPLPDLMVNMSGMIYVAISLLFSEFDYEAKKDSNTGMAMRVLATVVERLSHADAGSARMRQSWLRALGQTPLPNVRLRATPTEPCGGTASKSAGSRQRRPA
jgi:hypothetical protein